MLCRDQRLRGSPTSENTSVTKIASIRAVSSLPWSELWYARFLLSNVNPFVRSYGAPQTWPSAQTNGLQAQTTLASCPATALPHGFQRPSQLSSARQDAEMMLIDMLTIALVDRHVLFQMSFTSVVSAAPQADVAVSERRDGESNFPQSSTLSPNHKRKLVSYTSNSLQEPFPCCKIGVASHGSKASLGTEVNSKHAFRKQRCPEIVL